MLLICSFQTSLVLALLEQTMIFKYDKNQLILAYVRFGDDRLSAFFYVWYRECPLNPEMIKHFCKMFIFLAKISCLFSVDLSKISVCGDKMESRSQCAAASGIRDGSRPPATGLQEQVANHRKRLWLRVMVVSVTEKVL